MPDQETRAEIGIALVEIFGEPTDDSKFGLNHIVINGLDTDFE